MKYKKYRKFKDSGVEWLGEVPDHWSTPKLKLFINTTKGFAFKSDDFIEDGIPVVKMTEIKNGTINKSSVFLPSEFRISHKQVLLNTDDIIVSTVGSSAEVKNSAVGQIGIVPKEHNGSLLNQNTVIFSPNKQLSKYYLPYILKSQAYREHLDLHAHGTANQASLNLTDMLKFIFPFPPFKEQQQIAKFLDNATQKMDTLIQKQENLIKLLKEKRQAVISHAVTRGLNPDVKFKDSGVEWLGEVPEHWGISKLKYLGNAIIGLTYSPSNIVEYSKGTLVLRSSNIQNGKLVFNDNVYVNAEIPIKLITKENDIVICSRNGSRRLIGKNAKVTKDTAGHSFGAFTTVYRSKYNNFIFYILNSSLFTFQSGRFLTTTINQLTTGTLNTFEVPFPSIEEQKEIVNYLDDKTKKIDTLIKKATKSIKLLKEKRTALISAAVTGKIDVRELV